jgi:hypothetical protein
MLVLSGLVWCLSRHLPPPPTMLPGCSSHKLVREARFALCVCQVVLHFHWLQLCSSKQYVCVQVCAGTFSGFSCGQGVCCRFGVPKMDSKCIHMFVQVTRAARHVGL